MQSFFSGACGDVLYRDEKVSHAVQKVLRAKVDDECESCRYLGPLVCGVDCHRVLLSVRMCLAGKMIHFVRNAVVCRLRLVTNIWQSGFPPLKRFGCSRPCQTPRATGLRFVFLFLTGGDLGKITAELIAAFVTDRSEFFLTSCLESFEGVCAYIGLGAK